MKKIRPLLYLVFLLCFSIGLQAEPLLKTLEGQAIPISSLKGRWIVLHYWASWCESCLLEIPTLNQFYDEIKEKPVTFYAVNYDWIALEEQKNLIKTKGIRYPSLSNDPSTELNLGDIPGLPMTFIINPEGKLLPPLYGQQTVESLFKSLRFSSEVNRTRILQPPSSSDSS